MNPLPQVVEFVTHRLNTPNVQHSIKQAAYATSDAYNNIVNNLVQDMLQQLPQHLVTPVIKKRTYTTSIMTIIENHIELTAKKHLSDSFQGS